MSESYSLPTESEGMVAALLEACTSQARQATSCAAARM
jgi:hypothetical protein